jgi:hypothetical protein
MENCVGVITLGKPAKPIKCIGKTSISTHIAVSEYNLNSYLAFFQTYVETSGIFLQTYRTTQIYP